MKNYSFKIECIAFSFCVFFFVPALKLLSLPPFSTIPEPVEQQQLSPKQQRRAEAKIKRLEKKLNKIAKKDENKNKKTVLLVIGAILLAIGIIIIASASGAGVLAVFTHLIFGVPMAIGGIVLLIVGAVQ